MNGVRGAHIDSGEFMSIGHWPNYDINSDWEIRTGVTPDGGESSPQVAGSTDDQATAQAAHFIEEVMTSRNYFCTNYQALGREQGSDWIHFFPEHHGLRDDAPLILARTLLVGDSDVEEYSGQIGMLPTEYEVSIVVSKLALDDLKEFAASVMNVAVKAARQGYSDIETVRLLNSWFATMEETIAAGDDLEEILSRRLFT
ncbi:MAG: hypothetical protein OXD31_16375 [Chloroflexi bacterium]|nr:hypothetical protein [Chloroflexota bacterium]